MQTLSFTWLGHGTFLFRSPGGQRILIDPWLATNPVCPDEAKRIRELDLLLLTHGHDDHAADAVAVGRATGARAIAPYELALWLQHKGLQTVTAMNRGPAGSRPWPPFCRYAHFSSLVVSRIHCCASRKASAGVAGPAAQLA